MNGEYEEKLRKQIDRGAKADKWLNDDMYVEAVEAVRSAIISKWSASPLRDVEGQHELRLMLKILDDVTGYVKKAAKDGQFAVAQLERERRNVRERMRDAARELMR